MRAIQFLLPVSIQSSSSRDSEREEEIYQELHSCDDPCFACEGADSDNKCISVSLYHFSRLCWCFRNPERVDDTVSTVSIILCKFMILTLSSCMANFKLDPATNSCHECESGTLVSRSSLESTVVTQFCEFANCLYARAFTQLTATLSACHTIPPSRINSKLFFPGFRKGGGNLPGIALMR